VSSSTEQVKRLLECLKQDLALTLTQASRRFDIELETVKSLEESGQLYVTEDSLKVTHESRQKQKVTFLCHDERTAQRPGTTLRHMAGVAEMRYKLGSPRWALTLLNNPNSRSISTQIPDATWYAIGHQNAIAIEFDTGSQALKTISEKAAVYWQEQRTQIWAAPSARRANSILNILEDAIPDPLMFWVFVVDWTGDEDPNECPI
jgi:glutamyl/glutaminyl-tRNA synthetase